MFICWIVIYPVDSAIHLLNNKARRINDIRGIAGGSVIHLGLHVAVSGSNPVLASDHITSYHIIYLSLPLDF